MPELITIDRLLTVLSAFPTRTRIDTALARFARLLLFIAIRRLVDDPNV